MLYLVKMEVRIPPGQDGPELERLKAEERQRALELQRSGSWRHLWRVVGRYAKVSVFDVASNDELHRILEGLPLYPFMEIEVTPLASHPSALTSDR